MCGMSVSVGLRRVRGEGLSKALIVNGRGSKSKMIASLSLAAEAKERGGEISRAITRRPRPVHALQKGPALLDIFGLFQQNSSSLQSLSFSELLNWR